MEGRSLNETSKEDMRETEPADTAKKQKDK